MPRRRCAELRLMGGALGGGRERKAAVHTMPQ